MIMEVGTLHLLSGKSIGEAGHAIRPVNVYSADVLDQVRGCRGFMWRHGHTTKYAPDCAQIVAGVGKRNGHGCLPRPKYLLALR